MSSVCSKRVEIFVTFFSPTRQIVHLHLKYLTITLYYIQVASGTKEIFVSTYFQLMVYLLIKMKLITHPLTFCIVRASFSFYYIN